MGIYLKSSHYNNITNNNIYEIKTGIEIRYSENNNFLFNNISNNFVGSGDGFYIKNSSNNLFENNIIENTIGEGFLVSYSNKNTYKNNLIKNVSGYGFSFKNCNENLIRNNSMFYANDGGIDLEMSHNNQIINNIFGNNEFWGIRTVMSNNSNITDNEFLLLCDSGSSPCSGIIIEVSSGMLIIRNDFYSSGILDDFLGSNTFCVNCIGNNYFNNATGPTCPSSCDDDNDGVPNHSDLCPDSRAGEPVDNNGCDIFQFCEPFNCGMGCYYADWKNNEQNVTYPNDCAVVMIHLGGFPQYPKCVPTEFSSVCAG